jgi:putative spermidine/putrescine transport system permease protein
MSSSTATIALEGTGPRGKQPSRINPYWVLVLPLVLFLLVIYLYPIGQVLWISFSDPELGYQNYERLFTNRGILRMLGNTFRICFITTGISLVLGYLIAYAMAHVTERHRIWILMFVLVPFWVSVLARAFSWVVLLHDNGIINRALMDWGVISEPIHLVRNELGVLIGMVHYMIPYAVLPLYANLRGIDPRLVSAARGLGAGPFESFWRVYLPLSLPGIAGAGLLVFILTLGFFVTPSILGGGKTLMIAEYVSVQILQTVRWGVGSMLAMVLLVLVFLVFAVMSRIVDLRTMFGAK